MKTEIKDGNMIITIPMEKPTPSSTGKSLIVASSHGAVKTDAIVNGKPVKVNISAFIAKE